MERSKNKNLYIVLVVVLILTCIITLLLIREEPTRLLVSREQVLDEDLQSYEAYFLDAYQSYLLSPDEFIVKDEESAQVLARLVPYIKYSLYDQYEVVSKLRMTVGYIIRNEESTEEELNAAIEKINEVAYTNLSIQINARKNTFDFFSDTEEIAQVYSPFKGMEEDSVQLYGSRRGSYKSLDISSLLDEQVREKHYERIPGMSSRIFPEAMQIHTQGLLPVPPLSGSGEKYNDYSIMASTVRLYPREGSDQKKDISSIEIFSQFRMMYKGDHEMASIILK